MKTERQRLGAWGEQQAADYLDARGYQILDRNWSCRSGELDLVVQDPQGRIRAVEVKTRTSRRYGTGFDAITASKYRRLKKLLTLWCRAHHRYSDTLPVDVVDLLLNGEHEGCEIDLIQDVQP